MAYKTEYLLDFPVVDELCRFERSPKLEAWLKGQEREQGVFLSSLAIGLVEEKIRRLANRLSADLAAQQSKWLDSLLLRYKDQFLPVTAEVARAWGAVTVATGQRNFTGLIAATAQVHGLTVATANAKYFAALKCPVVNPWQCETEEEVI